MWLAEDTAARPLCQDEVWWQAPDFSQTAPIPGTISLTTMNYTSRLHCPWVFTLDNLGNWLSSVRRVNSYIFAGLIIPANSMGDFRMTRASPSSPCSLLWHPTPIRHSLFPFWFGWRHCFPVWCPNRCWNLFHLSHFNIVAYSSSKYSAAFTEFIDFHSKPASLWWYVLNPAQSSFPEEERLVDTDASFWCVYGAKLGF